MSRPELNVAILISWGGSTGEAILKAREAGDLDGINPVAVIASRHDAPGIAKAKALGYRTYVVDPRKYGKDFGKQLLALLQGLSVDLVSQNGWLPLTPSAVVQAYEGRIINQHPGPLDPGRPVDFGGKGMYGSRVTAARLAYTWATEDGHWTEATVHSVTEEFDKGALIAVSSMDIPTLGYPVTIAHLLEDSSLLREATLDVQSSLLPREHDLVVGTLRTIGATGSVPLYLRENPLVPDQFIPVAQEAKQAGIQLFPHG